MKKTVYGFIVACIIGGALLGSYYTGESQLLIPISIGALVGFFIFFLYSNRKTRNIPETDERTVHLLQKYFTRVLYALLLGSGVVLLVLYIMEIKAISVEILIVYMMLLYFVVALGAVITKRVK